MESSRDDTPVMTQMTSARPLVESVGKNARAPFVPKTEMGRILWAARQEIIAAGEPLEDPAKLLEEFFRQRNS